MRREEFEANMREELELHIDLRAEALMREGVPEAEARRRARLELDGINTVQEECRKARGFELYDAASRHLRYALRLLRRSPGFTATAVLTLAVCLGANLTIFTVIDSILLRPLPFPDAGRLVTMYNSYPKAHVDRDGSSVANYYERRGKIPAFASLSMYQEFSTVIGSPDGAVRETAMSVTPEFFATLGMAPVVGRPFTEAETDGRGDPVVILSAAYRQRFFPSDSEAIGKTIEINGTPRTVVGVLPSGFRFLSSEAKLFIPFVSSPQHRLSSDRHNGGDVRQLIARLAPGWTIAQAQSQIDAENAADDPLFPRHKMIMEAGFHTPVVSLHADHVARIRPALLLLQAGALGLLLIGAVNLLNLMLIRAGGRRKEVAVRRALGASGWQIAVEAVLEIGILAVLGAGLGLAGGAASIGALGTLGAERLPLGSRIAIDDRTAVAAVLAALAMAVLLAVPVLWFHLRSVTRLQARGTTAGRVPQRLRTAFAAAQVGLAFVLLAGAAVLGAGLRQALAVNPGFQPGSVLTSQLSVPRRSLDAHLLFQERVLTEIRRIPGVTAAGAVTMLPLNGSATKSAATVAGYVPRPGEPPRGHYSYGVSGDYFAAMGMELAAGRFLDAQDTAQRRRVCVVDADFARLYWPGRNPLGGKLFMGGEAGAPDTAFTVVGVVGAVKQAELSDPTPQGAIYYPFFYRGDANFYTVVRTGQAPESAAAAVRAAIRDVDPTVPVSDVRSMDERIAESLTPQRTPTLLAGVFSVMALLLTAIGTYGVVSFAVSQRRREIGVRMALGARPGQIGQQFLGMAVRILAVGAVLGIVGAWAMDRGMRALLARVPELDISLLAGVAGLLGVVVLGACLLPSRRAARVSPVEVLNEEG